MTENEDNINNIVDILSNKYPGMDYLKLIL